MTHMEKGSWWDPRRILPFVANARSASLFADWQIVARGPSSVGGRGGTALHVSHLCGKPQGVARGSLKPTAETFHFGLARRRRGRERLVRKPGGMLRVVLLRYDHRHCLKTWN